ncbi:MAG: cytochrome d ubiquinol oxidase subunit II [Coriobacteriia bacterium]|nr:cytochrome d ubiquinol oxidase subunit II [Coriobacteriia bacterium]
MTLQIIWFVLVGVLLVGYAVLDGFDLGVGAIYPFIAKNDAEKAVLRTSIGPVWDANEVWLLTGGGAIFAAFPPVYATVFSGFYLALYLVLFALIFRAVSIEWRAKDPAWAKVWDTGFFLGSALPALLFGVAAGNIGLGVPLDTAGEYGGTFFTLLNPFALLIGVFGLAAFVSQGAAWAALKSDGDLNVRANRLRGIGVPVTAAIAAVVTGVTALVAPARFAAAVGSPVGWVFIALLVAGLALAFMAGRGGKERFAFYGTSLTLASMVGIWAVSIFPAMVPSLGPGEALTIYNSSSSQLTLTVMLIVAGIGVPIMLAYKVLVYSKFAGKITQADAAKHY